MYIYSHSGSFNGRFDGWFTGLYWKQETHQPMRKGWGSCTQTSSVVNWDLLLWPPPFLYIYVIYVIHTFCRSKGLVSCLTFPSQSLGPFNSKPCYLLPMKDVHAVFSIADHGYHGHIHQWIAKIKESNGDVLEEQAQPITFFIPRTGVPIRKTANPPNFRGKSPWIPTFWSGWRLPLRKFRHSNHQWMAKRTNPNTSRQRSQQIPTKLQHYGTWPDFLKLSH